MARDGVDPAAGAVRPARLAALLNAALGFVAQGNAEGFVDLDALPAEGASVQVRVHRQAFGVAAGPPKRIMANSRRVQTHVRLLVGTYLSLGENTSTSATHRASCAGC